MIFQEIPASEISLIKNYHSQMNKISRLKTKNKKLEQTKKQSKHAVSGQYITVVSNLYGFRLGF